MSGIAGIAYLGGKSPSAELLLQMARSLSFRGPDGQQVWSDSAAGLVHAAHLIKGDSTRALGPESFGTGTWITADARLDARNELIAELCATGQNADASCSDSRLLLHAYEAWGEKCVHHVAGDFAFGIWDARRRQLFCACDQFGIRQLYFSDFQSCLIFSNTLDCVRLHPDVSGRLNDAAICDFLLFGVNTEESETSFADIRRLPRAHWLKWSADGIEIREYWRPATNGEIRYKKRRDYVEHFSELFRKAVADRIRGDSAGVLLSGGLDSSSVAAGAKEIELKEGCPKVRAFTVASAGSEDADGIAAQTVADALGIPFHLLKFEDEPFRHWSADRVHFPEPVADPFVVDTLRHSQQITQHTGVLLSGEGSDNLMNCEPTYHLRRDWKQGRRKQAARSAIEHVAARFCAPDGIRGTLRRFRALASPRAELQFPKWMNEDIVQRLKLRERWLDHGSSIPWSAHPEHPGSYASLFFPQWRLFFERLDPAYTHVALDVRHPFLDLRLVEYLLAIPAMPWFFRKFLLRESMRGRLPARTRKRAKTPAKAQSGAWTDMEKFNFSKERLCPELDRYVKGEAVERIPSGAHPEATEMSIRPWCLNFWLESLQKQSAASATATDHISRRRTDFFQQTQPFT
jgi:asparagine synthase (glutamine-hydrolysing)